MNGLEVRNMRESLGLTLRALAELAGVSHSTISRWENGDNIKLKQATLIADALALKMKAQYGDNGEGVSYVTTLPSGKSVKITITELE